MSSGKSSSATNVMKYTDAASGSDFTWTANPIKALNDCEATEFWSLKASTTTNALKIEDNGTKPDCLALTASWNNLIRN